MVDFTVAIPTFNGADRLPQVLEKLRSQAGVEHLNWEVIVVDNNSKDQTAAVVRQYQETWPRAVPLRYCFEAEQGLAYARQRAVDEAAGELIGFLDDDVLPATDWVASAFAFSLNHAQAGAYGGQIHGTFEVPPPEDFKRIKSFLAIRERGSTLHRYTPETLNLPPGAALVVRRQAWQDAVPNRLALVGRVNGSTLAGEDFESLLYMHRVGWEIWYNPAMHVHHQIPSRRLEREYLIPMIRGCGLCICQLRMINATAWQRPLIMGKILLGNLRRAVLHILKYRGKIKTDLIAACEMEFFLSSLISPLFYLRQSMLKLSGHKRA